MPPSIHGTAIAFADDGVLLRGPPGSGKSSLALRLIDSEGGGLTGIARRAVLVADDQVRIDPRGGLVYLSAPDNLAGLLEIRGLGLVHVPWRLEVPLRLVVDLAPFADIERMPAPATSPVAGLAIPAVALDAIDPAAPAKLRAALDRVLAKPPFAPVAPHLKEA